MCVYHMYRICIHILVYIEVISVLCHPHNK